MRRQRRPNPILNKYLTLAMPTVILMCVWLNYVTRGVAFLWVFFALCAGVGFVFFGAGWLRSAGKWPRLCKAVRVAVLVCIGLFIVSFAVIEGIIIANSDADDCAGVKYVIVAGAGLNGDQLSLTLLRRMETCYDFMLEHPDAVAVLCGGQGRGEWVTEASAMKTWLIQKGIPEERILTEETSVNTDENIRNAKGLIDEIEGEARHVVAVISSDYHMFRLKALARKHGMDPRGYPAPSPDILSVIVTYYVREYFSVLKYFIELTGLTLSVSWLNL